MERKKDNVLNYVDGYEKEDIVVRERLRNIAFIFNFQNRLEDIEKYYQDGEWVSDLPTEKADKCNDKDLGAIKKQFSNLMFHDEIGNKKFFAKATNTYSTLAYCYIRDNYQEKDYDHDSYEEVIAHETAPFYKKDTIYKDVEYYRFLKKVCDIIKEYCWQHSDILKEMGVTNYFCWSYAIAREFLKHKNSRIRVHDDSLLYKLSDVTEQGEYSESARLVVDMMAQDMIYSLSNDNIDILAVNLHIIKEVYNRFANKLREQTNYHDLEKIMDFLCEKENRKEMLKKIPKDVDYVLKKGIEIGKLLSKIDLTIHVVDFEHIENMPPYFDFMDYGQKEDGNNEDIQIYLFVYVIAKQIKKLEEQGKMVDETLIKSVLLVFFFDLEDRVLKEINKTEKQKN